MAENSKDRRNVYESMWRPIKVFGLPRDYFYVIGVVIPLLWGMTQSFLISFGVFSAMYVYGYFKSQKDPEFMLVHLVRLFKLKGKTHKFNGQRGSMYIV